MRPCAKHRLHDVDVEQMSRADPRIVGRDHVAGPQRRGGKRSSIAASVRGAVPVNDGTLYVPCAIARPRASNTTHDRS